MASLYKQQYNDGWSDGVFEGYMFATVMFMFRMHDKYGWGKGRLDVMAKDVNNFVLDNLAITKTNTGRYDGIDFEDILQVLRDECGLYFNKKKGSYYFTDKNGNIVGYEESKVVNEESKVVNEESKVVNEESKDINEGKKNER